jgi:xanthine dehydrogenase accessory factor
MNSMDTEVLQQAIAWRAAGHRVVLGTVVRTWGSAPRPPGSWMAIRDDGRVAGSLSGGCIEDDLVERVRRGELAALNLPQSTTYGATAEESQRFGLPCGGSVQIVLEPLHEGSGLAELLAAVRRRQRTVRTLHLHSGQVTLSGAQATDTLRHDGRTLRTLHGPRLRLFIIGGGQLSRYLATMAVMLDYAVTVCEPRLEYHEGWETQPGVVLDTRMPDDLVLAEGLDAASAVVAVTHDPKLDDLALMEALGTDAFYVGALGSRRNNDARRARLAEHFGLSPAELARLHGPVGLNLGGLTPPEVALAILAEMTAVQRGAAVAGPLADWSRSKTVCAVADSAHAAPRRLGVDA